MLSDRKQFLTRSVSVECFHDLDVLLSSMETLSLNNAWHGTTYQEQGVGFLIRNLKTFSMDLNPLSFGKLLKTITATKREQAIGK